MNASSGSRIEFVHDYLSMRFPRRRLTAIGNRILSGEKISSARCVTVVLCSDRRIRTLNARWRNIDRPTDVLSFPFDDADFLGEIYISLQRCRVQAGRYGLTYDDEIARMFVHGMVHLLGYDHLRETDRKRMERVERKYCLLEKR